jgi:hypothetical protein
MASGLERPERDWFVRPYRPEDGQRVAELYDEVYHRALDLAFYNWKLHSQQAGSGAPNVWVAESNGRLVGHYGGTPRRFCLQGRVVPARHTSDAMTSAQYRHQGVYSAVGDAAHAAWADAGEPFLFGLPNDKWGSRVAYLNYRRMFPAIWLRRPLLPERLLAERARVPAPLLRPVGSAGRAAGRMWDRPLRQAAAGVQVESITTPGPEFDELWVLLREEFAALVVRDMEWVKYRYVAVPGCDYYLLLARRANRPAGYLAYRLTEGANGVTGWIMDLFTAPADEAARAALLLDALTALRERGAGSVRVLLPPGTALFQQLRRAGFSPTAGDFGCHIVPLAWPDPPDVFHDPNRWFTMAGDYDII